MSPYARDEFDDVPFDADRRGAFRAERRNVSEGKAGLVLLILAGALALLLGGLMFVYSPAHSAPSGGSFSGSPVSPERSAAPAAT